MVLSLRFPGPADEAACRRLHEQLAAENFAFLQAEGTWKQICAAVRREHEGVDIAPGRVRSSWLVADVDGEVVGRVSIRHVLNDFLLNEGGHVGYAVGPEYRRRGYATDILRLAVADLAARGVERVLVTCDDTNTASAGVIEKLGGILEDVRPGRSALKRRYWIVVTADA
ncbi:GNAT family N-acetyltransferase [Microbacterium oryzae]|uniref:GNAT family N-acetyltransferase n=1 Tax=Microbacterium oryzae TaxID=743009 RepID=UPI0025B21B42|nr:GNAT family N-acetyltransferase [Microbacterium oryzae]MDN3309311.1 GNAT family N-acetyltransferase [Microbacterium oryzae]